MSKKKETAKNETASQLKNEHSIAQEPVDIPGVLPYDFAKEMAVTNRAYQGAEPSSTHGPQNAEHELRMAYNEVIQAELVQQLDTLKNQESATGAGLGLKELARIYRHAFRKYRDHHPLSAERWAHVAKHFAKALFLESKIRFLEQRPTDLPYLAGATEEDYDLIHQKSDTVGDLLTSVASHIPPGLTQMPDFMERCLRRARQHLQKLDDPEYHHELLRADRIKAAYHYGRVIEVIALAYDADHKYMAKAA